MAGIENTIIFSQGEKLQVSTSDDINRMQETATDVSRINHTGSPEGVIAANPSSLCHDPSSGDLWKKATGTGNTGWELLVAGTISSLSPYIVGPTNSDFTDIPTAISQAVSDGASYTNQKNIYLKPNNGTAYAGGFTVPDGINLIGFDWSSTFASTAVNSSVTIDGQVTVSSGNCKLINLNLTQNNGNAIAFSGGTLSLVGVTFNLSGTSVAIAFTGTSAKVLDLINVDTVGTTSSLFSSDGSTSSITISSANLNDQLVAASTFSGPGGNVVWNSNADVHGGSYIANCATFSGQHFNDSFSTALTAAFVTGASTTGNMRWSFCQFNGAPPVSVGNAAFVVGFPFCYGTSFQQNIYASSQQTEGGEWFAGTGGGLVFGAQRTGYRGSEQVRNQAFVQTTDATVTTLLSVTLNQLETVTLRGTITAAQSDHSNAVGGDFEICARRASGGNVTIVQTPVTNVLSSSAATFTCDVDTGTQTVRVRVTGVAATTYNWSSTYAYQKMLNNT